MPLMNTILQQDTVSPNMTSTIVIEIGQESLVNPLDAGPSHTQEAYIERLPIEILSEILLHCPLAHRNIDINQPPWVFGKVSHRWRDMCLGTPLLWINIPPIRLSSIIKDAAYLGLLHAMLKFSAPMPMSICAAITIPEGASDPEVVERNTAARALIPLLASYKDRISKMQLDIDVQFLPLLDGLAGSKLNSLAILDDLRFHVSGDLSRIALLMQRPPVFLDSVPMLKVLKISTSSEISNRAVSPDFLASQSFRLNVPWTQLTSLMLQSVSVRYVLDIVKHTPGLGVLEASGIHKVDSTLPLDMPIVLEHLKSISVKETSSIAAEEQCPDILLNKLTLPSLTKLNLGYSGDYIEPLIKLIDRSDCSLESFSIDVENRDHKAMWELYKRVPALHTLILDSMTTDELDLLTEQPLLPKLRDFSVYNPTISQDFANSCRSFVRQRTTKNDDRNPPALHMLKLLPAQNTSKLYYYLECWDNDPETDNTYREALRWGHYFKYFLNRIKYRPMSDWVDEDVIEIIVLIEDCHPMIETRYIFASRICDLLREIVSLTKLGYDKDGTQDSSVAALVADMSSRHEKKLREFEEGIDEYWRSDRWIVVDLDGPNQESDIYFVTEEGQRMNGELQKLRLPRKLPPGNLDTLDIFLKREAEEEERRREADGYPRRVRRVYY